MEVILDKPFKVKFKVLSVFSHDMNIRGCSIKVEDYSDYEGRFPKDIHSLFGPFIDIAIGSIYMGEVVIKKSKSGHYLKMLSIPFVCLPETHSTLVKFLDKNIKGVGRKTLEKAVNTLGVDFVSKMKDNPTLLEGIVKTAQANKIYKWCCDNVYIEELFLFLESLKLPSRLAFKIYQYHGINALNNLKKNPYLLSSFDRSDDDVLGISFKEADTIAYRYQTIKWSSPERLRALIYAFINYASVYRGDTCVLKSDLIAGLNDFMYTHGVFPKSEYDNFNVQCSVGFDKATISKEVNLMIFERRLYVYVNKNEKGQEYLYLDGHFKNEVGIAKLINKLTSCKHGSFLSKKQIRSYFEDRNLSLSEEQKASVFTIFSNNLSILTGGPGTGKTFTTKTVVDLFRHYNPNSEIRLLAPTGKASSRMKEVIGLDASTIHSALKIFKGAKSINASNSSLYADLLIVDEFSMVDSALCFQLLHSISPSTIVVFVGDVDQLPSVGAGAVLHNLIGCGKVPVCNLTQIFRQAQDSEIVMNAHKIKTANKEEINSLSVGKSDFYFIESKSELQIQEYIVQSMERLVNKGYKLEEIMLLTPMHKTTNGTIELNSLLQGKFNPNGKTFKDKSYGFRVGDRVICIVNDNETEVRNGDLGYIRDLTEDENGKKGMYIEFDNYEELYFYPAQRFDEIKLAYAITIHKSQGSEAKVVLTPFSKQHRVMLNSRLIYTGVTRAKSLFIGIGNYQLLKDSSCIKEEVTRLTNLKDMILED